MRDLRVLVCGSRNWTDHKSIWRLLNRLRTEATNISVIEGCAQGADYAAHEWIAPGVEIYHFPADWDRYGKGAGPIRNQQMLDEGKPDFVMAFTEDLANSKGTKDMVSRARRAGLTVLIFGHK